MKTSESMLRVLMVDDDPVHRMMYKRFAEKLRLDACIVDSAQLALEKIVDQDHNFRLILMDWQMPNMDGLECTQKIRELNVKTGEKPIPIVAVTAHAFHGDKEKCLAVGMDDYLSKPFSLAQLEKVLELWTDWVKASS